jgi:RNA polymerase sigma factor (sigma-70 family)
MTPVTQQAPTLADTMTALYTRYHGPIRRFIGHRVHSDDLADDLTQETFVRAWHGLPTYDSNAGSYQQWLYRIASHVVARMWRDYGRRAQIVPIVMLTDDLPDPADPFHGVDPVAVVCAAETLAEVEVVLAQMTPRDQAVFRLWLAKDGAETSLDTLADHFGCKTMKDACMLMWRVRKRFAALYARGEGEDVVA